MSSAHQTHTTSLSHSLSVPAQTCHQLIRHTLHHFHTHSQYQQRHVISSSNTHYITFTLTLSISTDMSSAHQTHTTSLSHSLSVPAETCHQLIKHTLHHFHTHSQYQHRHVISSSNTHYITFTLTLSTSRDMSSAHQTHTTSLSHSLSVPAQTCHQLIKHTLHHFHTHSQYQHRHIISSSNTHYIHFTLHHSTSIAIPVYRLTTHFHTHSQYQHRHVISSSNIHYITFTLTLSTSTDMSVLVLRVSVKVMYVCFDMLLTGLCVYV